MFCTIKRLCKRTNFGVGEIMLTSSHLMDKLTYNKKYTLCRVSGRISPQKLFDASVNHSLM